jgi:hypothetical protein
MGQMSASPEYTILEPCSVETNTSAGLVQFQFEKGPLVDPAPEVLEAVVTVLYPQGLALFNGKAHPLCADADPVVAPASDPALEFGPPAPSTQE